MNAFIPRYKKENTTSYTVGAYPTLELLDKKPEQVVRVVFHSKIEGNYPFDKIKGICRKYDIPYEINSTAINRLSPKENIFAVAEFNKYETELEQDKNKIVLVNPANFGNCGTIIRSMCGFNIFNLVMIRPAVDIFHPEVIRSSMGSVFSINYKYYDNLEEYSKNEINNVYIFDIKAEKYINEVRFQEPCTLVFGSEGSGFAEDKGTEILENVNKSERVKIPMSENIDSFNLAVSASIAMYKLYSEK